MINPVTELYGAADAAWNRRKSDKRLEGALNALSNAEAAVNKPLFEVLDFVATSKCVDLVRWVVGLSEDEQALLGQALANQQELVDEWAPEEAEDARRFVAMREGFVAAVSGGEGVVRCQCHLEAGDSPCQVHGDECGDSPEEMRRQLTGGEGGAKKEAKPTILPAG